MHNAKMTLTAIKQASTGDTLTATINGHYYNADGDLQAWAPDHVFSSVCAAYAVLLTERDKVNKRGDSVAEFSIVEHVRFI